MSQSVGDVIKESRENLGVSQRELATFTNKFFGNNSITRGHLSNVELGTSGISVKKLNLLTSTLVRLGAQ